jgi:hypothetical protein
MTEEQKISVLLKDISVPLSRVTVDRAVQNGRRDERRRRAAATGAVVVVIAVLTVGAKVLLPAGQPGNVAASASPSVSPSPSPTKPKPMWTAESLPVPGGAKYAEATAIDPTGRYIAGGAMGTALLWDNGSLKELPPVADGFDQLTVTGVNASGMVIGIAENPRPDVEDSKGWVYHNGVMTVLAKPKADVRYQVIAINARGDILGWGQHSGVLLWNVADPGTVRQVPGLDSASGLGDDGTIGGNVGDGDHPGIIDPAGNSHRVAELPGRPGGKIFAINGDWAAGWVPGDTSSNLVAARWNLRTGELRSYPELAEAVNVVSGTGALVSARAVFGPPVFVAPDGQIIDLPPLSAAGAEQLASHGPGGIQLRVNAISADARILVGSQTRPGGGTVPVVWHR